MAELQVLKGTWEDLAAHAEELRHHKELTLIIPPEEDPDSEHLPDPPNTVRDQAHLEELLLQGIASPKREMTKQEWDEIRQAVQDRLATRKSNEFDALMTEDEMAEAKPLRVTATSEAAQQAK